MKKDINKLKIKQKTSFEFTEVLDDVIIDGAEVEKVEINYLIELVEGEVIIRGEYKAYLTTSCVRCLEDVKEIVEGEFFGHYKDSKDYAEYIDSLGKEAQSVGNMIEELIDDEVDISSLVRDYIILDMPQFPACEPECDGLEEMEKYSNNGIDSRWQQLLDLKS